MDTQIPAKKQLTALLVTQDVTAVPFSRHIIFQDFAQDGRVMGGRFYGEQITHVDLHFNAGTLLRQLGLAL